MDFFEQMEARIPHGEVRTRFAPSPTGYMHVGNLRTALYTWLIARRHHGKFILRIEDTDQGRLVEGAVDVIYKTMAECGLTHDEGPDVGGPVGPYVQSERRDLFGKYAKLLCEKGALRELPGCARAYRLRYNEAHGILEATAVSAVPLTAEQTRRLHEKLEKLTGKTIDLKTKVDPAVLGGIRLDIEGTELDGTVQNRLVSLRRDIAAVTL